MEIRVTLAGEEALLWSADNPFDLGVIKCSCDTPYIQTILRILGDGDPSSISGFTFDDESLEVLDVIYSPSKSHRRLSV